MPWVAISYGALDLRGTPTGERAGDLAITPIHPGDPVVLSGDVAALWLRLVSPGIDDTALQPDEQDLIREFAAYGIASNDEAHPHRVRSIDRPWLSSPLHELVYALIANVAESEAVPFVFIKGPAQHAQGLRDREHSGDVDVWVRPEHRQTLGHAMARWGWVPVTGIFTETGLPHSQTLLPGTWGCSIDVHTRFPGMTLSDVDAFDLFVEHSETWRFAGRDARVPRKDFHAIIRALHDMRPRPGHPRSNRNIGTSVQALRAGGESTIQVADRLGSLAVLAEPLGAAFPGAKLDLRDSFYPEEWGRLSAPTRTEGHRRALLAVPMRERPRILFRLVWPTSETALAYEAAHGRNTQSALKARARRLIDGSRELLSERPRAIRRRRT